MADPDMDEDLFADLYDGEDADPVPVTKPAAAPVNPEPETQAPAEPAQPEVTAAPEVQTQAQDATAQNTGFMQDVQSGNNAHDNGGGSAPPPQFHDNDDRPPIGTKEDGKMFIGGLNWETTDQSLKDYFSQFGEVVECTVMRDGATGRSRGFGFLTFKDPKHVNTVMVKEHQLDGKLIDPKRAIPRDEQERTAKIFVGGVSQEATEQDFKTFFMNFGRVLDATLMMDKDTGRPRGFGFVTFDSDAAVDRTLEGPLAIHGKPIEVKRAQPRGNMREENANAGGNRFGGRPGGRQDFNNNNNFGGNQQESMGQEQGGPNNMSPAMMAAYWQRMQQYFQMMQSRMQPGGQMGGGGMGQGQMNPAAMQQMMAGQGGGMNPAMIQQMQAMQGGGAGGPGAGGFQGNPGSPNQGNAPNFNAQDQHAFEQQKYERQSMGGNGTPQQDFSGQNTWEGMYDDVPAPAGMQGQQNFRGGFAGRGRGGGGNRPTGQAPAGAPTGPKNAGRGGSYRGGGRGGHRGYHPYARGGGGGGN